MLEARNRRTVSNNTAQLVLFWDSRLCTTVCSTACMYCFSGYPVRTRFFYLVKVLILGCLSTIRPNAFKSCIFDLCTFHDIHIFITILFIFTRLKKIRKSRNLVLHKHQNAISGNTMPHCIVLSWHWRDTATMFRIRSDGL